MLQEVNSFPIQAVSFIKRPSQLKLVFDANRARLVAVLTLPTYGRSMVSGEELLRSDRGEAPVILCRSAQRVAPYLCL